MGMFDTLYDDNAIIKCPHCGLKTKFPNGIQSKKFDSVLGDFYVGDVLPIDIREWVEDYDWCPACKKQIPVYFGFKYGIFTGIYPSIKKAEKSVAEFDVYKHYRKQYRSRIEATDHYRLMKNRLETTIKIHGSKPSKSNFSFLFTLHNDFLDYDIIQTLKNILKKD